MKDKARTEKASKESLDNGNSKSVHGITSDLDKLDLSQQELKTLSYRALWSARYQLAQHYAHERKKITLAGGTLSSNRLRDILILKNEVVQCGKDEDEDIKKVQKIILISLGESLAFWRLLIEIHNAQQMSCAYSLETGLPIDDEDLA